MQEEMKCPTCGGDKFKFLGGDSYKCAYCGATFTKEDEEPEVEKEVVTRVEYVQVPQPQYQPQYQAPQQPYRPSKGKSKGVAIILALFLGSIGIHKFYLDRSGQGILYLLFCWTFIPAFLSFIDFIVLLCTSESDFDEKYNY